MADTILSLVSEHNRLIAMSNLTLLEKTVLKEHMEKIAQFDPDFKEQPKKVKLDDVIKVFKPLTGNFDPVPVKDANN